MDQTQIALGIDIAGIGFSVTLCLVFFYQRNLASFFFGLIFFAFFLKLFDKFLWLTKLVEQFPWLVEYSEFAPFLVGPSLYLYAYSQNRQPFRRGQLLHFLPAALVFLNFSPLYFGSIEKKICYIKHELYEDLYQACEAIYEESSLYVIHEDFIDYFNIIQLIVYVYLAIPLLKNIEHTKARKPSKKFRNWSLVLIYLAFFAILNIFLDVVFLHAIYDNLSIYILTSISFLTLIHLLNESLVLKENLKSENYASVAQVEIDSMIARLKEELIRDDNYLHNPMTLKRVASNLHIPRNKLSYALKEKDLSFRDLLNQLKVEKAKVLMQQGDIERFKIEAIGEQAGFRSKATFYKYFKEYEGMTPKKYVELLRSKRHI